VLSLSGFYPYWGYRKIYNLMKTEEIAISRERVRLIRRREGLQVVTRRKKRKILGQATQWVHRALYPNHVWSYDFVFDQTGDHRTLKCMTIVDEFTRQGFDIHVSRSITSHDVTRILDRLFQQYGRPVCLRSDNGSELIASAVQKWLRKMHVDTHYIEPGSPWQNGYCESFNSIFRITCLDRWWFSSLTEARVVINQWLEEVLAHHPPPMDKGKRVKMRYLTQVSARPPTFALFVNRPKGVSESYRRYLVNELRAAFYLTGTPIRLHFRAGKNPYVTAP